MLISKKKKKSDFLIDHICDPLQQRYLTALATSYWFGMSTILTFSAPKSFQVKWFVKYKDVGYDPTPVDNAMYR